MKENMLSLEIPNDPARPTLEETILGCTQDIKQMLDTLTVPAVNEGQRPFNPVKCANFCIEFDLRAFDAMSVTQTNEVWEGQHRLNTLHVGFMIYVDPNHTWPQRHLMEPQIARIKEALNVA